MKQWWVGEASRKEAYSTHEYVFSAEMSCYWSRVHSLHCWKCCQLNIVWHPLCRLVFFLTDKWSGLQPFHIQTWPDIAWFWSVWPGLDLKMLNLVRIRIWLDLKSGQSAGSRFYIQVFLPSIIILNLKWFLIFGHLTTAIKHGRASQTWNLLWLVGLCAV